MGRFPVVEKIIEETSKFLLRAEQHLTVLSDTVDAVNQNTSASPTEKMLARSIGMWLDGLAFWTSMAPRGSNLPMMIKGIPSTSLAQTLPMEVDIEPPSGVTPPKVTPIMQIGGTIALAVATPPAFDNGRRKIKMAVTIPASATKGTYAAIVHQDQTPLASVVVYIM